MFRTVTIQDQLPFGEVLSELHFTVSEETLTVRDLIHRRVHEEVSLHNLALQDKTNSQVQPTQTEAMLNAARQAPPRRPLDWQKQAEQAEQAFERNGFFVLVDNHQVEDLNEVIQIGENTRIAFVRLVPLVGG